MQQQPASAAAVLLIAHGSRRREANAELVQLAVTIADTGRYAIVERAYLELARPTIEEGAELCVTRGARRVLMLPFFLSAGLHVTRDLEESRQQLAHTHAGVEFVLCQPLGLHPLIVDIVFDRLRTGEASSQ